MLRGNALNVRKYLLACLMAAAVSCLWLGSDVFAGKNKNGPNPFMAKHSGP